MEPQTAQRPLRRWYAAGIVFAVGFLLAVTCCVLYTAQPPADEIGAIPMTTSARQSKYHQGRAPSDACLLADLSALSRWAKTQSYPPRSAGISAYYSCDAENMDRDAGQFRVAALYLDVRFGDFSEQSYGNKVQKLQAVAATERASIEPIPNMNGQSSIVTYDRVDLGLHHVTCEAVMTDDNLSASLKMAVVSRVNARDSYSNVDELRDNCVRQIHKVVAGLRN